MKHDLMSTEGKIKFFKTTRRNLSIYCVLLMASFTLSFASFLGTHNIAMAILCLNMVLVQVVFGVWQWFHYATSIRLAATQLSDPSATS